MQKQTFQWITQKEASEIAGKTLKAIHQLAKKGRLRTKAIYGKTLVLRDDVLNYKPQKAGRPRKVSN